MRLLVGHTKDVRAVAYLTLQRDEYPPFGDESYPAGLVLSAPTRSRDRLTVAFRPILAIPHFILLWFLGIAWGVTTLIAWVSAPPARTLHAARASAR